LAFPKHSTARRCFSFVAQHLAIGDEAHIRDRLLGAQRRPSADFPATGLMTSALQNPLDTHVQDRSPERVAPVTSARQQRVFMRALGCGGEELVARVGAETAIKRVETELRRDKRARSRKLLRIVERRSRQDRDETGERRNTKPARSAELMATSGHNARMQN
jgi:hypothetical protein